MEKEIGNKIRKIRELKGFSQEYLANQIGISQRAYSKLEMNQTKIDWTKITKIAEVLEIDPIDLVSFDDNIIFNSCNQSGKFENFFNNFPEKLIEQYDLRIKDMGEQIEFLKEELRRKK